MNGVAEIRNATSVDETDLHHQTSEREGRFVYGGVEFAVLGPERVDRSDVHFESADSKLASLTCEVHGTPRSLAADDRLRELKRVHTTWSGSSAVIEGKGIRARLRDLGGRRFVATVQHLVDGCAAHPVEETLAQALIEKCGGVVLHAASIEHEGEAIAFVGPSGAGKTTACGLTGRPLFSRDRLAVAPMDDGRWWAWPLLGGSSIPGAASAPQAALPLRAVLRVDRSSSDRSRIEDIDAHAQLFTLRESCLSGSPRDDEAERLSRLVALAGDVRIARIATVLGDDPLPTIRGWLA